MTVQPTRTKIALLFLLLLALTLTGCAPMPVYAGADLAGDVPTSSASAESPDGTRERIRAWGQQDPDALRAQIFPDRQVSLPAYPVNLAIPTLDVNAAVEAVGRTVDGAMDVPTRAADTAWYRLGAAPGQEGTAVIAGHLDLANGDPSVFYELGELGPGDAVQVTDSDGITHTFAVDRVERYAYDKAPLAEIFGFQPGAHLNLITCAGSWNDTDSNYSERLVVYTTMVE